MKLEAALIIGGGALGLLLLSIIVPKVGQAAAGIVTGDNALTRGATDASGASTSAYVGAGVVGTLGAAANEASGGWLASGGAWLGRKTFDITRPDPVAQPDPVGAVATFPGGVTGEAAAAVISGSWLPELGGWLGRTAWDVMHPDPMTVMNGTR